jgi:4-hydroxy-tetrahydrodipicolinate reductase
MAQLTVLVTGAAGRMGRQLVQTLAGEPDLRLVAAVDITGVGLDAGRLAGGEPCGVAITDDLAAALARRPQVMADFTAPAVVMGNLQAALAARVPCVVGTTGWDQERLECVDRLARQAGVGVLIAPNFALGAVLMMEFAARAARYFPAAEIVELHHPGKQDAPSGTALKTAQMMLEAPGCQLQPHGLVDNEATGLRQGAVRIHSVRLPGLVAHQEVILGGLGETLTIRHDSLHHQSFMPGVLLALRKVGELRGLVYGLEHIL